MNKVCLLIGEGESERYFVPRLLEQKGFKALVEKGSVSCVYQKENVYWFFPFPPQDPKVSGSERLKRQETYRIVSEYVGNNKRLWGDDAEVHLFVLYDTDCDSDNPNKLDDITAAIKGSKILIKEHKLFPVVLEIESWYLAGLNNDFPFFKNTKDSDLIRLLTSKTDNKHSKENFESHVSGLISAKDIAVNVADHFDHDLCCSLSNSYKEFFDHLQKNSLM